MAIITDAREKRIEKAAYSHLMHAPAHIFKGKLSIFTKLSMVNIPMTANLAKLLLIKTVIDNYQALPQTQQPPCK
ncbi:hypothetical protein [Psychrobacter sp. I-STPA10]|uniref:hypothetical protein n=1 Tax=Psychrobacter sp. I-STPA10 TaxID=2585769 RepID=UPI001E5D0D0B|nr:hypothetical protein [Psychrobacter sp. I-STPA10]